MPALCSFGEDLPQFALCGYKKRGANAPERFKNNMKNYVFFLMQRTEKACF